FAEIEGTPVQGLARWDGTTWTSVGYPYLLAPVALTLTPNGDLIVVDLYAIERLSGGTWSIEAAILGGYVNTATTLVDGTIVFAGNFSHLGTTPAMNVAQLRGGTWSALGGGVGGIASGLTQLPDGDLVVVGDFDHAFDGGGAKVVDGIARWDGQQWTSFAGSAPGNVQAIVRNHDDSLTFAGFLLAGSGAQNRLATIRSACPAQASSFGLGCAGSAGTVTLAAESRPWLGGTYAARASGLPAAALGVSVLGFAPSMLPLATVLPASANCFLFSTADQLELSVPGAGVLTTHLPIPDSLALTGATFRQQVLTIELGSAGIVDVSASNGLLLTIGSL
ncbi:MAG: hypothetical protein JNN13_13040, partial [Planctomycetes bacterium]|nr:hypothetical protein [Planctomycetota bacterium]